jgi:hypothetical protein
MPSKCLYCGSEKIEYTCKKCNSTFCSQHLISNENYSCKKHNTNISKETAESFETKCTVIDRSICPKCRSEVLLDKVPNGQFFLRCTKCTWDSSTGQPNIHYITQKLVLQDGITTGIVKKPELCDIKLKKNKGIEICANCFIQTLVNSGITNFATIKNMYNLESDEIIKVLNQLKTEKRIFGQIDTKNQLFIYIPDSARDNIKKELEDKGILSIQSLASRFNVPTENAIEFMYDMLKTGQFHGTFDSDKLNYYTTDYLNNWLTKTLTERGRLKNTEIASMLKISAEIAKHYAMELLKSQKLLAYFADTGNEIVTVEKLKNEIDGYSKRNGIFKICDAANDLKVAEELVRKTIFGLVQDRKLRGIFTQKREFISEQELSEQIRGITKAYRTIKLRELARKLGITELRVEEILASLISRGAIYGYIDMNSHEFVADVRQPTTQGPVTIPTEGTELNSEHEIEIVREYDFVGGQLHFKVVTRNNSGMAIHDIRVVLDVPSSYRKENDFIKIPVIDPHNSRGVDFYLEPGECGISTIAGTVIYKDATGTPHTIHIKPKEVQIKCPLVVKTLDTIEDIQLTIQSLPSDARAFLIADLDPQLAYRAAFRAITNFDTRNVTSVEIPDQKSYQAEAWFSSEAKVTGGRIITRILVQGANESIEIRVWCNDAGQLTGFLAKIVEILFLEINLVRKVKSEARSRTLDVMTITQNLITSSDYCAVRYKAKEIFMKLEDTHARMIRVLGDNNPLLARMDYWLQRLAAYPDEEKINEEDSNILISDIESWQNSLARSIMPG